MKRPALPILFVFGLALAGCLPPGTGTQLVPDSPFGHATPVTPQRQTAAYTAGPVESAARVDSLGRQILGANPQIGMRPAFAAIGGPQPAIFHMGTESLFITDGLVKQCHSEGQLAAVLCTELAKMVSEREARADPRARIPERMPPMDVPIGNDNGGSMGSPDQTHLAELARFQHERRSPRDPAPLPPDPQMLANRYLTKAGYPPTELDSVAPLLREAARYSSYEKQLTAPAAPPARPWTQ